MVPEGSDQTLFKIRWKLSWVPESAIDDLSWVQDSLSRDSLAQDSLAQDSLAQDSLAQDSLSRDSLAQTAWRRTACPGTVAAENPDELIEPVKIIISKAFYPHWLDPLASYAFRYSCRVISALLRRRVIFCALFMLVNQNYKSIR